MELTEKQKIFCFEYIIDWNATRAYRKAYPDVKDDNVAGAAGYRLLRNVKIDEFISETLNNIEKAAGISKLKVINEFKTLAFSNISTLHNTWIERKDFEELTDEQKNCIQEIETKTVKRKVIGDEWEDVEYVKVKLYDKQRALENICKILGYNAPEKTESELNIKNPIIKVGYGISNE